MSKLDQIRALRERNYSLPKGKTVPAKPVNNVNNGLSQQAVINKPPMIRLASNAERQARWRSAHPELARERTRNSMRALRKRRAEGKP